MNNIIITGRLAADAVVKENKDGSITALFRIASRREYVNSSNEVETDFIPCSFYVSAEKVKNKQYGVVPYLQKGKTVNAVGSVHSYSKQDSAGNNIYGTNIQINNIELVGASTAIQKANAKAFAIGNAQTQAPVAVTPAPVAQTVPVATPAVTPAVPAYDESELPFASDYSDFEELF